MDNLYRDRIVKESWPLLSSKSIDLWCLSEMWGCYNTEILTGKSIICFFHWIFYREIDKTPFNFLVIYVCRDSGEIHEIAEIQ